MTFPAAGWQEALPQLGGGGDGLDAVDEDAGALVGEYSGDGGGEAEGAVKVRRRQRRCLRQ